MRVPAPKVRARLLELVPGTLTELGLAMGRPASDKTLRKRLGDLEADGLLARDERGVYALIPAEPEPTPDPVTPPEGFEDYRFPAHFDHEAQELFVVKLEEYEFIEWTSAAIEALESYITCLQRSRKAHEAVSADGEFALSDAGRTYVHPGVAVAERADKAAQGFRKELRELDEKGGGMQAARDKPEQLDMQF